MSGVARDSNINAALPRDWQKILRILHVTECVGGGVGRALDQIPGSVPEYDHFLLSVRPSAQNPTGTGFVSTHSMPRGHFKRILCLRHLAAELQPNIIHAHSSWAGFYARASNIGPRIVYQPHGYAFISGPPVRRLAFFAAEWILAQRESTVAVLSPHEFRVAGRLNPRSRRVLARNAPTVAPTPRPSHGRDRCVVMVGRICDQKDPDYFLALKQTVTGLEPTIAFRWIGDGDAKQRRNLERQGVYVTGWLGGRELVAELQSAGLYAHTARYEGFPQSILDAAACGLPVVARAIPAFQDCPITQYSDVKELGGAILQFFDAPEASNDLTARNIELLHLMSPARQRASLLLLYDARAQECVSAERDAKVE